MKPLDNVPPLKAEDVLPWVTYDSAKYMEANVKKGGRVFEWGAGASTVWFALRGCTVCTVESELGWINRVSRRLEQYGVRQRVVLLHVPKGKIDGKPDFTDYINAIDGVEGPFDTVMVDGIARSRNQCLIKGLPKLAEDGLLILDNSDVFEEGALRYTPALEAAKNFGLEPKVFAGKGRKRPWNPAKGDKKWETTIWQRPQGGKS